MMFEQACLRLSNGGCAEFRARLLDTELVGREDSASIMMVVGVGFVQRIPAALQQGNFNHSKQKQEGG